MPGSEARTARVTEHQGVCPGYGCVPVERKCSPIRCHPFSSSPMNGAHARREGLRRRPPPNRGDARSALAVGKPGSDTEPAPPTDASRIPRRVSMSAHQAGNHAIISSAPRPPIRAPTCPRVEAAFAAAISFRIAPSPRPRSGGVRVLLAGAQPAPVISDLPGEKRRGPKARVVTLLDSTQPQKMEVGSRSISAMRSST